MVEEEVAVNDKEILPFIPESIHLANTYFHRQRLNQILGYKHMANITWFLIEHLTWQLSLF